MKKLILYSIFIILTFATAAQSKVLIGYWHNWDDVANARYIQLDQIDSRYNVICVAFATPVSPSDMHITFTPDGVSSATFISQIQTLKSQGKKVLISIGGANSNIQMPSTTDRDNFSSTLRIIINTYNFDGIDIDVEHGNSFLSSGTVSNPTNPDCINFIDAVKQVRDNFLADHGHAMMLTFAPETANVTGGLSYYGGNTIFGSYLPIIYALRNDLSYIHMQLYNSGSQYGLDMVAYSQETADFIVALTEAMIKGFTTWGNQGVFPGIPANKVVIGLPSCPSAAPAGGYVSEAVLKSAVQYLMHTGPKPGSYTLQNAAGYPNLAGLMCWSINWDKMTTCNPTSYEYATAFQNIFGTSLPVHLTDFYATLAGKNGLINWKSENEINFAAYELQHSVNGVNFEKLKTINVNTSSSIGNSYNFIDNNIASGINYYRLKMIDADGSFSYSKIITLFVGNENEFAVYPNPAKDILHLKGNSLISGSYIIRGIQGQNLLKGNLSINKTIDISTLATGTYILSIGTYSQRFIKIE